MLKQLSNGNSGLALSDSDPESDLIWLLSVTRCRATYADNLLNLILWCLIKICNPAKWSHVNDISGVDQRLSSRLTALWRYINFVLFIYYYYQGKSGSQEPTSITAAKKTKLTWDS